MPLERTLQRVEQDIARGDLGTARQRLHSLIDRYPYEPGLRDRLAEVYAALQYPDRAGCFWYLAEQHRPEQQDACGAFERACGGSAVEMLRRIKFCGDLDRLGGTHAARVLRALQQDALEQEGLVVTFRERGRPKYDRAPARRRFLAAWGCAAMLLTAMYLLVAGVIRTVQWLAP